MADERQVTGSEEFDAQLAKLVDDAIANRDKDKKDVRVPEEKTHTPEPLKLKIGDEEYKFDTQEQLNTAINNMVANYNKLLEKKETPVPEKKEDGKRPKIDVEQFAKKFTEDPEAAFNEVDEHRFGFKNVPEVIKGALGLIEAQRRELVSDRFIRDNPDFDSKNDKFGSVVGDIIQKNQLPFTKENLELAWSHAKTKGLVELKKKDDPLVIDMDEVRITRKAPARVRNRTSETNDDIIDRARDMSSEELEQVINGLSRK